MVLVGIDACPAGWVAARYDGAFSFAIANQLSDLVAGDIVVVDIPFGLIDAYPRQADALARTHLSKFGKSTSVFPSPLRAVLSCADYATANELSRQICGKGLTKQTYMLFDRIRQAEELAPRHPIYEGHPELTFALWSGVRLPPKRTFEGASARLDLVRDRWPDFTLPSLRGATADDTLDAVALVWTASRIADGTAMTFPDPPVFTPQGIRSTIYA